MSGTALDSKEIALNYKGLFCRLIVLSACLLAVACGEGFEATSASDDFEEKALMSDKIEMVRELGPTPYRSPGWVYSHSHYQDLAITAAHCFNYRSRTRIGRYRTFTVTRDGRAKSFIVNRYKSFGTKLGADDIALVGLAQAVPESFAKAAPLALAEPIDGSDLTVYGYGCTRINGAGRAGNAKLRFRPASNLDICARVIQVDRSSSKRPEPLSASIADTTKTAATQIFTQVCRS